MTGVPACSFLEYDRISGCSADLTFDFNQLAKLVCCAGVEVVLEADEKHELGASWTGLWPQLLFVHLELFEQGNQAFHLDCIKQVQKMSLSCTHMLRMPLLVKSRFRKRDPGEPLTIFSGT